MNISVGYGFFSRHYENRCPYPNKYSEFIFLHILPVCLALIDVPSMGYSFVVDSSPDYEPCTIEVLKVKFKNFRAPLISVTCLYISVFLVSFEPLHVVWQRKFANVFLKHCNF